MRIWQTIAVLISLMLAFGAVARADSSPPTVVAMGTCVTPETPDVMRVRILVSAEGREIHEAAEQLKKQRDDLKAKLIATGAVVASVKFNDPQEGTQVLSEQERERESYNPRHRGTPSTQPSGVTLSTICTADWPLSYASPDEGLLMTNDLQTKIKAAIPKAVEDTKAKTPEEEEIAQEMAAQRAGDESAKQGEPQFIFVHHVTPDERSKMLATAFSNAQDQAKRLATAANKQIGALSAVSSSKEDLSDPRTAYLRAMLEARNGTSAAGARDEIVSDQRGELTYTVSVDVTFLLQ